jgi:class 3 adenylate cyclase
MAESTLLRGSAVMDFYEVVAQVLVLLQRQKRVFYRALKRKQVTVLFCDLVNSTLLAERLGPEHMHTLLNRFFELALEAVHRYEGTVNLFLGDGFMALFGAPIAHEDHARRAVLSALALQRTLKEVDLGKSDGVECTFRMGLNSGHVVVGSIGDNLRMDYSAVGDTTNLTARLQQSAAPGTILICEAASRLVKGYIVVTSFFAHWFIAHRGL